MVYKVVFVSVQTKEVLLTRQLPDYPLAGERVVFNFRHYDVILTEWHLDKEFEIWIWLQ